MADPIVKKITQLTEATSIAADDLIAIVDVSETIAANKTKKAIARLITLYNTAQISDGIIIGSKIATGAVTADKLSANAVETAKIKDANVSTVKIADGAVTGSKIAANAVETAKIKDGAVTAGKLANGVVIPHYVGKFYRDGTLPDSSYILPAGWSITHVGSGRYRITHNFNSSGYAVVAMGEHAATVSIPVLTTNNFELAVTSSSGATPDEIIHFVVFKFG